MISNVTESVVHQYENTENSMSMCYTLVVQGLPRSTSKNSQEYYSGDQASSGCQYRNNMRFRGGRGIGNEGIQDTETEF